MKTLIANTAAWLVLAWVLFSPFSVSAQSNDSLLDTLYENIQSGGPPKDGIPPIENPQYVSVSSSENFLNGKDAVFVVEASQPVKIFPQSILVWHEIVNDEINGEKASVTYCPLTGSAIGYKGRIAEQTTTFGTSGKLVNSNLIMYDRATSSFIPQILGVAVAGKQKGTPLEPFPVVWTTWEKAKTKYPDARVLSQNTGFSRAYGNDPYGSYLKKGTYYDSGKPLFPVLAENNALPGKEVVVGLRVKSAAAALRKKKLSKEKVLNFTAGNISLVAFYGDDLDTVRVFKRAAGKTIYHFEFKGGKFTDKETGSFWTVYGECFGGKLKGKKLKPVHSIDAMWFAWDAYYPATKVYK